MDKDALLDYRQLLKYAMTYGFILGIFWFAKYIFLIAQVYFVHFIYLYHLLSIATLFLYYVLLNRYRDKALGGYISYGRCILFSTILFFFAGCIESVIIYVHVSIIDTHFIANEPKTMIAIIEKFVKIIWQNIMDAFGTKKSIIEIIQGENPIPSNALYVVNGIFVNASVGFLLSLIYGMFVRRQKLD